MIESMHRIARGDSGLEIIMTATATTTEIAAELDTTPRELRKFLRSEGSGIESVGKGARYSLPSNARSIAALKKRFIAWQESNASATADAPDA